ncbi:hypothetical protein [Micromonospora avicenniae]|uniref:hypothetical protein n=1 Tax=Micromonospora avicenniae TaxID=1198245 RepID=UPI00332E3450
MKNRRTVVRPILATAAALAVLAVWLSNPTITVGITWPVAFLLAVAVVCASGLAGWTVYVRNRYTDEPED